MKWKEVRETIAWIFGIIGAIIVVYSFVTRPSVNLTATVEYHNLVWPAGGGPTSTKFEDAFSTDSLREGIKAYFKAFAPRVEVAEGKELDVVLRAIAGYAHGRLLGIGPPDYNQRIKGYYSVELRNGKNQEVKSVELVIPHSVLVLANREGQNATTDTVNGVFKLSRVGGDETVSLIVWVTAGPRPYNLDEIKVRHEGGMGEVKVRRVVGSFGQFCDELTESYLVIVMMLTVGLAMLLVAYFSSRDRTSRAIQNSKEKEDNSGHTTDSPAKTD
jgi:hypothetical protein